MYHPYCQSPSALTEYLKQKLHHQRAKHLGCSPTAQVEQNVPLERNTTGQQCPNMPHTIPQAMGTNGVAQSVVQECLTSTSSTDNEKSLLIVCNVQRKYVVERQALFFIQQTLTCLRVALPLRPVRSGDDLA